MRCVFTLILSLLTLAGCDRQSGLSNLPDYELADRANQCINTKSPSPGLGHACVNVRKECEKREKHSIESVCPFFR